MTSWKDGQIQCKKENGSLAMLKSPRDVVLVDYLKAVGYKDPFSYIGLRSNLSALYMYR